MCSSGDRSQLVRSGSHSRYQAEVRDYRHHPSPLHHLRTAGLFANTFPLPAIAALLLAPSGSNLIRPGARDSHLHGVNSPAPSNRWHLTGGIYRPFTASVPSVSLPSRSSAPQWQPCRSPPWRSPLQRLRLLPAPPQTPPFPAGLLPPQAIRTQAQWPEQSRTQVQLQQACQTRTGMGGRGWTEAAGQTEAVRIRT